LDVALVGHMVVDTVVRSGEMRKSLGGTVVYGALAALKHNARPLIISKIGEDFPDEYLLFLSNAGVNLSRVKVTRKPSTRFKLVYHNLDRTLYLLSRCEDITAYDIRREDVADKPVIVGAVIGEVSKDALEYISSRAALTAMDIQGYIRQATEEKEVTLSPSPAIAEAISNTEIIHAELYEAKALWGIEDPLKAGEAFVKTGVAIALITVGEEGSYVVTKERALKVPAARPSAVVDATGSGDVYMTVFTIEYHRTGDLALAAAMASAASSFLVEKKGVAGLRPRWVVKKRAEEVLNAIEEVKT